jgi:thiol-disulfide isomerase/thioredoxin
MKKIINLLLLAAPFTAVCQQQQYKISGQITGLPTKAKAYLVHKKGNHFLTDSCQVKNGVFAFSGMLEEPQLATLVLGHQGKFENIGKQDVQPVYLESGTLRLEGKDSLTNAKVWGTPLNVDLQEKTLLMKSRKGTGRSEESKLMAAFVAKHPASRVSLDWLEEIGGKDPLVIASYAKLSTPLKQTPPGRALGLAVKTSLSIRAGKIAPDFALADQDGRMIKLSDFRGKYVLLDFWASWCKPCRAVQPYLKSVYKTLEPTGKFVILAVSLDKNKAAWLKAIAEDGVPWLQVADLNVAQNKAALLYNVTAIPANFLIDPNGILLSGTQKEKILADKKLPLVESSQQKVDVGRLSNLNETTMLDALKKEKLDPKGFKEDYKKLDSILETDIGEYALALDLAKLDIVRDSAAFYDLVSMRGRALNRKKIKMKQAFIVAHPDSFVSLHQLNEIEFMYSADTFAAAYMTLSDRLKQTSLGQAIKARIDQLNVTPTGMTAIDFSRNDQYGKAVKLSDYRGKYVLLDFWGSWCVPCRQTHPHLKELYAKYKAKGLEIVAVANEKNKDLDKAKQAWLAAIKKDDINWVHVLNEDGSGRTDIAVAYGVHSYPTKFLLDRNGKILMRVASGLNDEMDILLKKLLDD